MLKFSGAKITVMPLCNTITPDADDVQTLTLAIY